MMQQEQLSTAIALIVSYMVAFAATGIERHETVLAKAATSQCFNVTPNHNCHSLTYVQDGGNNALNCAPDFTDYVENYAAQCAKGTNGRFCFDFFFDFDFVKATEYSCTLACSSLLSKCGDAALPLFSSTLSFDSRIRYSNCTGRV